MYRFRTAKIVAAAVAEVETEAIQDWLAEHSSGISDEEALCRLVKEVHTITVRRPQGNILVTVSVLARRAWHSETFFFHLQTTGNAVTRVEPKPHAKR